MPRDIVIEPMGGREGQVLRTTLEDRINPTGQRFANPRYRLAIALTKNETPVVIEKDGTIRRYNVDYYSTFQLFDTVSGKQIHSGKVKRSSSYNVLVREHFATFVSQRDAAERGLQELAEDYRMRLANFFEGYGK